MTQGMEGNLLQIKNYAKEKGFNDYGDEATFAVFSYNFENKRFCFLPETSNMLLKCFYSDLSKYGDLESNCRYTPKGFVAVSDKVFEILMSRHIRDPQSHQHVLGMVNMLLNEAIVMHFDDMIKPLDNPDLANYPLALIPALKDLLLKNGLVEQVRQLECINPYKDFIELYSELPK